MNRYPLVIPAQAGISCRKRALNNGKTPAFAGVTVNP